MTEDPKSAGRAPPPERDLETKVRDWLDQQGYPLEMRVARRFYEHRFVVDQSRYYHSDDGKAREVDVIAYLVKDLRQERDSAVFEVQVVAECKANPKGKQPWLVFTAPTNSLHGEYEQLLSYHLWTQVAKDGLEQARDEYPVHKHPLLSVGERQGYGIVCANIHSANSNDDVAYQAVCSLVDAARAFVSSHDDHDPWCQLTLPVLAVSTPLFECWLDEHGQQRLERRDYLKLIWRRPSGERTDQIMIHVVHEDGLAAFAHNAHHLFETVSEQCATELVTAVAFETKRYKAKPSPPP